MPAVNPRITITLQPSVHVVLRRISELTGNSQSSLVGELLEQSLPIFERMVEVLTAADKLRSEGMKAPAEVAASLERAQAKLEKQLGLAFETMDDGFRPVLQQAEAVARRAGRSGPAARPKRSAAAPKEEAADPAPMSNRGVTPHRKGEKQSAKGQVKGARRGQV